MIKTEHIKVESKGNSDIIDITRKVKECLNRTGAKEGVVNLFVTGSTAGLAVIEHEPGLVRDFQEMFESIAPKEKHYHHHERWHDDNGHSHVRASLLGPSLTLPFSNSELILGTWQQIVLVDFDTSHRKRVVVFQCIGE